MNTLGLKWGTLKSWSFPDSQKADKLFKEYRDIGSNMSAMAQRDTPRQKEIICELIEEVTDPNGIYLDWDGKYVTKEEAKEYVRNYGKSP